MPQIKCAVDKYAADKYAADKYTADKYAADEYAADKYAADKYVADKYAADSYIADRYAADEYTSEEDEYGMEEENETAGQDRQQYDKRETGMSRTENRRGLRLLKPSDGLVAAFFCPCGGHDNHICPERYLSIWGRVFSQDGYVPSVCPVFFRVPV